MGIPGVFSFNQYIIQVDYNEGIQLFRQDLVNLILEASWSDRKIEAHELIFDLVIPCAERYFRLTIFSNSHLMMGIGKIQPGKLLSTAQLVQKLVD